MIFPCREIQNHYPQLTAQDAVEWCRSGRLRPFTKRDGPCGLDPKSPKGWRRVFPTKEADEKYNLFRRRQRETAEISRLLAEIEELEGELNPGKVWGDPRLPPEKIFELLADSFLRSEDIEKILKQLASEEA